MHVLKLIFHLSVVLSAPDTVLIERQSGKRIDRVTGEVYHTTFDWPQDPAVQARMVEPEGITEAATRKRLVRLRQDRLLWLLLRWMLLLHRVRLISRKQGAAREHETLEVG